MSNIQLSVSSLLRQQRKQAIDTPTRLEPQQKQMELSREKEMEELKREKEMEELKREIKRLRSENQSLRSENDSLRSESTKAEMVNAPPSGALVATNETLASNYLSQQFTSIVKSALEFDIRSLTTITSKELELVCGILHCERRRNALSFMQAWSEDQITKVHFECLLGASHSTTGSLWRMSNGDLKCFSHENSDCVWITKKDGQWWVGSCSTEPSALVRV
jgi:hypothetical protein